MGFIDQLSAIGRELPKGDRIPRDMDARVREAITMMRFIHCEMWLKIKLSLS